jgi:hypothetical protein
MLPRYAHYVTNYYRDLLVDLVRMFMDIPLTHSHSQGGGIEDETLAQLRNKCIRALDPLSTQLNQTVLVDTLPIIE